MKKVTAALIALLFVGIGFSFYLYKKDNNLTSDVVTTKNRIPKNKLNPQNIKRISVIAHGLDTPWGIVFLPDNSILATERKGDLRLIDSNGNLDKNPIKTFPKVKEIGEGGLLGIDIHPDFKNNHYVYFYYTYEANGTNTKNRVIRAKYENKNLGSEEVIVDNIPGASNHNGGRIKFGPDGNLYIGTGDAQVSSQAQVKNSLAGKILRVTDLGKPVFDNPFNNEVYSYGHRNVQGITWDKNGNLWATEHGRSAPSGFDELNLIRAGQNYGWPDIEGDKKKKGMVTPVLNSGSSLTWAPSGTAFLNDFIYFAGLRGQTLYKVKIVRENSAQIFEYLNKEFGRLRDVIAGPDGMLYITTSNRDGRGNPDVTDDKILRINPSKL